MAGGPERRLERMPAIGVEQARNSRGALGGLIMGCGRWRITPPKPRRPVAGAGQRYPSYPPQNTPPRMHCGGAIPYIYQPGTSASACIARASSVLVAALNVVKSGAPHVGRARDIFLTTRARNLHDSKL